LGTKSLDEKPKRQDQFKQTSWKNRKHSNALIHVDKPKHGHFLAPFLSR